MLIKSSKSYGIDRVKIVIYGQSGVGKTSLAKTTDGKTLIISAESGLTSINDADIDVIDITVDDNDQMLTALDKWHRLKSAIELVKTSTSYSWLFVDSITEIGQVVLEAIKESDKKYLDPKNGLQMWGVYGETMRGFIKTLRDLPKINVVLTCLAKQEKDEMNRKIMSLDIQGRIADHLPALFDEVFFYHLFNDESGERHRYLATGPTDYYTAKDRSGKLQEFEQPNLAEIARKIRG